MRHGDVFLLREMKILSLRTTGYFRMERRRLKNSLNEKKKKKKDSLCFVQVYGFLTNACHVSTIIVYGIKSPVLYLFLVIFSSLSMNSCQPLIFFLLPL